MTNLGGHRDVSGAEKASITKTTVLGQLHSLGAGGLGEGLGGLQSCPNSGRRYAVSGGRGQLVVGPQPMKVLPQVSLRNLGKRCHFVNVR